MLFLHIQSLLLIAECCYMLCRQHFGELPAVVAMLSTADI